MDYWDPKVERDALLVGVVRVCETFFRLFGYMKLQTAQEIENGQSFFETLLLIFLLIASINLLYKSDFITYFIKTFGNS